MRVLIEKGRHLLTLSDGGAEILRARVGLGRVPVGGKRREGDCRTPEGVYQFCIAKENGKFGRSLGLNYPNAEDARRAYAEGAIDRLTLLAVETAICEGRRPPWGTVLGGEVYVHEGDPTADWTAGCLSLAPEDMAVLYNTAGTLRMWRFAPELARACRGAGL